MATDDISQIKNLLSLYAFALDAHQFDLFDLIFTDDVVADFGPAGALWTDLESLKQVFVPFHDLLDNQQHQMMGQVVHVDGDRANAFSYGNWLLTRHAAPHSDSKGPSWLGTGWYDDELIRTDKGWRIKRRIARLVSWTGNPYVPEPEYDTRSAMGTHRLSQACENGDILFLNALRAA